MAVTMLPGRKLDVTIGVLIVCLELRRLNELVTSLIGETIDSIASVLHVLVLVFVIVPVTKKLIELSDEFVDSPLFMVKWRLDPVKKILIGLKKPARSNLRLVLLLTARNKKLNGIDCLLKHGTAASRLSSVLGRR